MSRVIDFDRDDIIEKAMNVFWAKGYKNTSVRDLMDATGLLKGSIYNAFESKENLFLICLERYGQYSKTFHYKDGEDPSIYLKRFFKRLVDEGVDQRNVKGCLIMNSCLEFSETENQLAERSKLLFEVTELNLKRASDALLHKSKVRTRNAESILISAAFSIREISKFKKDEVFLTQIANNALACVGLTM